jgi:hypothetical protein
VSKLEQLAELSVTVLSAAEPPPWLGDDPPLVGRNDPSAIPVELDQLHEEPLQASDARATCSIVVDVRSSTTGRRASSRA